MDYALLPDSLRQAAEFHGHLCPGLMIGWRAALAAAQALELSPSPDEEVVAVVENDSCSVDAFQWLLSTTFGKGNLKWLDHGKQAFTVIDRKQNRAVRVYFRGDHLKDKRPDGSTDREAYMKALLSAPDEEILEVHQVEPLPPDPARIEPSLPCARCGEATQKSKTVSDGDRVLCRPCARELGL
ncbi:MAG: FmdE family protein [Desulfarculaceae bacterium]|jgi:formylmethanofuran dehydrogenase subunit E